MTPADTNTPTPTTTSTVTGTRPATSTRTMTPTRTTTPTTGSVPSIILDPAAGIAGSYATATGHGVAGSPGVRIVWWHANATITLAQVEVDYTNAYRTQVQIPSTATVGTHHVCVVETRSANARFVCTTFSVLPTPNGQVSGRLFNPGDNAPVVGAGVSLQDRVGAEIAATITGSNGDYDFQDVPPDDYSIISNKPGHWFKPQEVTIKPGESLNLDIPNDATNLPTMPMCEPDDWIKISQLIATLDGSDHPLSLGNFISMPGRGVPVINDFLIAFQSGAGVNRNNIVARFAFQSPGGGTVYGVHEDNSPADLWTAQYDMSSLPVGMVQLRVDVWDRTNAQCVMDTAYYLITMRPARWFQPWIRDPEVTWSSTAKRYHFAGVLPNNPTFVIDRISRGPDQLNRDWAYAFEIRVEETYSITGKWTGAATAVWSRAKVAGRELIEGPPRFWPASVHYAPKSSPFNGEPYYTIPNNHLKFEDDSKVIEVPIFNIGLVDIGFSVDWGSWGTIDAWGSVRPDLSIPAVDIDPTISDNFGLSAYGDLLWGLAGISVGPVWDTRTEVDCAYVDHPPPGNAVIATNPCNALLLWVKVRAKLFWFIRWTVWQGVVDDWEDPEGCAGFALQTALAQAEPEPFDLFAMPALAALGTSDAMAVWIMDQDPGLNSDDPEVVYSHWNGVTWSAPAMLTHNDHFETDPQIASLGNGRALAVWTQNTIASGFASEDTGMDEILNHQEIYSAVWDGAEWSTPIRVTANDLPDGRANLAGDPTTGHALAAWVHDGDGDNETRGDWEIQIAWWNGDAWSTPKVPFTDALVADLQPSAAVGSDGVALLAWTREHDLDPNTNSDRRLAYSIWDGASWSLPAEPAAVPAGAMGASAALDNAGNPLLVFIARGNDPAGNSYGVGHRDYLWSAYQRAGVWETAPIGIETVAEEPILRVDGTNRAVVAFRKFGKPLSPHYSGEVALAAADLNQMTLTWSEPQFLTSDADMDWQIALDLDPTSQTCLILDVKLETDSNLDKASGSEHTTDVLPHVRSHLLARTTAGSDISALTVAYGHDLTITGEDIELSNPYPGPEETVTITATIRNKGQQPVDESFQVRFVLDADPSGTLLGSVLVDDTIGFNETTAVAIQWQAVGDEHEIQVLVDAGHAIAELDEGNNEATQIIGTLPAPTDLRVDELFEDNGLSLSWGAPPDGNATGYRVYRSLTSGGPYDLVGEAMSTSYEDAGTFHFWGELWHKGVENRTEEEWESASNREADQGSPHERHRSRGRCTDEVETGSARTDLRRDRRTGHRVAENNKPTDDKDVGGE